MRVAIDLTPLYNRKYTGVERYGVELYSALKDLPVELYPIFRKENNLDSHPNTQLIDVENRVLVENLLLSKKLRSLDIDVALFPIFPPPVDIYFNKRFLVVPTIHDLAFKLYPSTLSKSARYYMKPKYHMALRYSDKILTISNNVKLDIEKNTLVKVFNWGESISKDFMEINSKINSKILSKWGVSPDNYFLSVSTIEPRKNFIYLLRIFKEYRKICSNVRLVLVGRKGWGGSQELKMLLDEMKESVVFTDYISNEELISLYYYSSAFMLLSIYEGFGRTPLEALACGSKVFVSDIPVFRETLGDSATYLPLNDVSRSVEILNGFNFNTLSKLNVDIPFNALDDNVKRHLFNDLVVV